MEGRICAQRVIRSVLLRCELSLSLLKTASNKIIMKIGASALKLQDAVLKGRFYHIVACLSYMFLFMVFCWTAYVQCIAMPFYVFRVHNATGSHLELTHYCQHLRDTFNYAQILLTNPNINLFTIHPCPDTYRLYVSKTCQLKNNTFLSYFKSLKLLKP